jgi:hypothetical protein
MTQDLLHAFTGTGARPVYSRLFPSRRNEGLNTGILLGNRFVMRATAVSPSPSFPMIFSRWFRWCLLLVFSSAVLRAFPPAPYYTLFGIVRDQVGATLKVDGAELILLKDGKEIGRSPVSKDLRGDFNYELRVSVDQNLPSTRAYSEKAVAAGGLISVVVTMNGQQFYPIGVSGSLRATAGGERVRLDLNLGADTDGDGLPDAWEEWQLYIAGRRPGANGWDLSPITRDGDFDGDGISNFHEYIAGTFAADPSDRFELRLLGKTASAVQLEFFGITGKVYTVEESSDLRSWATVPFSLTAQGAEQARYQSPEVGIRSIFVKAPATTSRFYRLSVR